MNGEKRRLEINDEDIRECIKQTDAWYALASLLYHEYDIRDFKLWIGDIRWGDNEIEGVTAHYQKGKVFFTKGGEKHTTLVPFIIHAWAADETIEINFNRSIYETVGLVAKYGKNDYIWDIFDENLYMAQYSFHMGELL